MATWVREQDIQFEILRYLRARGILAWKASAGGMGAEYKGKQRFVFFGVRGQPDIMGILPGGRFLGIEVKSRNGRLTPQQHAFLAAINTAGGVAMVCRSVAQCDRYLTELIGGVEGTPATVLLPLTRQQQDEWGTPSPPLYTTRIIRNVRGNLNPSPKQIACQKSNGTRLVAWRKSHAGMLQALAAASAMRTSGKGSPGHDRPSGQARSHADAP